MKNSQATLSFLLANLLLVSAYPFGPCGGPCSGDDQQQQGSSSGGYPPAPPPPPSGGTGSSDPQSFGPFGGGGGGVSTYPTGSGSSSSSSSASSASGSSCQVTESSPGNYKVTCGPPTASIQSEHILWLTSDGATPQAIDIEVPNYKILELIKAGFKAGSAGGSNINVLLKKPETSVDAQIDTPKVAQGPPKVSITYEQPEKKLVHFPNDKPYSPLQGPILPPLAGGGAPGTTSLGRSQRQIPFRQQFQQQRPLQRF